MEITSPIHTVTRNMAAAAARNNIITRMAITQGPDPRLPISPRRQVIAAAGTKTEQETTKADAIGTRTSIEKMIR